MSKKTKKTNKKPNLNMKKPLKKSSRRKSTSKKPRSKYPLIKNTFILFMVLFIFGLFLSVYAILNNSKIVPMLSRFIAIKSEEVILKSETLTQKTSRIEMKISIENRAWFPIYLNDIIFDLSLGDYVIAKNFQAKPQLKLLSRDKTVIPIGLNIDSIITRRALQKTVEKNASELIKKLLSQVPTAKNPYGDDINVVSKITGKTNLFLQVLDYNLPFEKKF